MDGNQSGAEKDNRRYFIFSQSGAELRIQDGRAHESRPCKKNSIKILQVEINC